LKKVIKLSHDVISTRLNKIVSLSASPVETNEVLQSLALEERILYDRLHGIISEWRSNILTGGNMP
jgi:DNA replication initiation complex subunit (GINS family)